jgi:hypothetical protein
LRISFALAVALVTLPLSTGHAAELAKQGAIDATYTAHNAQAIPDLDAADEQKAYVNEAFLVLTSAAPQGDLLGGKSARCLGYGSYDAKGAYHEDGRCTFVDADGDQVFETYVIGSDVNPGRGQITGGTGKYKGVKGEYVLTYEPMATFAGGHSMGRGTKKGSYTIGE